MNTQLLTLLAVFIVSLVSIVGIFTLLPKLSKVSKVTSFLVLLAAGTLIGDVFIHIIPELYEEYGNNMGISISILVGIFFFFALESIVHWHHCTNIESTDSTNTENLSRSAKKSLIINNLLGDAIHNFIDGMLIAASFAQSTQLGIATTIAVLIHEIPQELGDFGILIHSGLSKLKALLFNFMSALAAILGAVVVIIFGELSTDINIYLLGFAAGAFLYIAMVDILPGMKHSLNIQEVIGKMAPIVLGIALMFGLTFMEGEEHESSDTETTISTNISKWLLKTL